MLTLFDTAIVQVRSGPHVILSLSVGRYIPHFLDTLFSDVDNNDFRWPRL